jgi:hypothetical protein
MVLWRGSLLRLPSCVYREVNWVSRPKKLGFPVILLPFLIKLRLWEFNVMAFTLKSHQ